MPRFWAFFIFHYSFFNALSVTHLRATSPKGRGLDFAKACAKHLATVGTGVLDGPQTKMPEENGNETLLLPCLHLMREVSPKVTEGEKRAKEDAGRRGSEAARGE